MPDPTYYVYWISNRATSDEGSSLRWSLPFPTVQEAGRWAKAKVDDGLATLAAVFEFPAGGGPGRLKSSNVYPAPARRAVLHYLDMVAHAARGVPPSEKGGPPRA